VSGAAATRKRGALLGLLLAGAAGCSAAATSPPQCAGILIPALRVTIVDSLTRAFIGAGSTLIARSNTEVDTLVQPAAAPNSEAIFIGSGVGSYELAIRKAGYDEWRRSSIVVAAGIDGCHPSTADVEAKLVAPK
jgi:hypothetical protein